MIPHDMENMRKMATDNGRQDVHTAAGPQQPPIEPKADATRAPDAGSPERQSEAEAVPDAMPAQAIEGQAEPGEGDPDSEVQAEFERGMQGVSRAIYEEEALSDQIIGMINEQEKIGSIAKAVITVITQVDKQLDIAEPVLAPMAVFTADRLMELAETAIPGMQYSEKEQQQIVMTVTELLLATYGVSPERAAQAGEGMSPEEMASNHQEFYGGEQNG